MPAVIVVGIQWGDEGKGKMVDILAQNSDFIVRSQGGNNAGHTIKVGADEYRFHLIPSGILYPHVRCFIAGGTVIDPEVLLKEIASLEERKIEVDGRLFISPYAHVIFPYHQELDRLIEKAKGANAIGTTGRGIGPCYVDKTSRMGIRFCEFLNPEQFEKKLKLVLEFKNFEFQALSSHLSFSVDQLVSRYEAVREKLKRYMFPVEDFLDTALKNNDKILFEGAHGTFLDNTFGTYPYVTSSSCLAAGICSGAGIGPSRIDHVLGVVKSYITRVGNGPLPTSLNKEEELSFLNHAEAREIGTTTGRKRRIGWFDAPLARFACKLNGVDSLAVMKLDVLDHLPSIKIGIGYKRNGKNFDLPPPLIEEFEGLEPVYTVLPGWQSSTREAKTWNDLPDAAKKYLNTLEDLCGVSISYVSMGPERDKTITLRKILI